MNLKNKNIVITGGARGLGYAMANTLATEGAKIALVDMNQEQLNQAVEQAKKNGLEMKAFSANVADEQSVMAVFDQIQSEMGQIDGLINNAGILRDGLLIKVKDGEPTQRMPLDQWQSVIDVNLTGVFLCGREAAARMAESGTQGVIINISSVSRAGNIGQTNYSAAKAGVAAMTVSWAKELSRYGIRVGAIAPGVFATEMVAQMKPEARAKFEQTIPLKRTGEVEELARAAQFIFENDYFTGRVLELDGGIRV